MIADSSKSQNPFREGLDAEASLDSGHLSATATSPQFPSPQSIPESSTSSYPPPTYAPPAYTNNDQTPVESGPADAKRDISSRRPTDNRTPADFDSASSYAVLSPQQAAACISRPAPQQHYASFEPIFLMATGQYLTRGFPALPPPSKTTPHPFASHDVSETDWLKFLEEVKAAGRLSEKEEDLARLPIVSILPIIGSISTHVIRQQMKKGKSKAVGSVLDKWNHMFFNPRHVEVTLMHGMTRLSGLGKRPTTHNGSTPGWPGDILIQPASEEPNNGKGKARQEDTTYRLFIMPLYISD